MKVDSIRDLPRTTRALAVATFVLMAPSSCSHDVRPPKVAFGDEGCVTVPLTVERGLLTARITVEGEELRFIVDTGSVQTLTIVSADAERLKLRDNGRRRMLSDAWGQPFEVRGFDVREIAVGAAIASGVRVWEARWGPDRVTPLSLGHVGRGILAAAALRIDVPHARMQWGTLEACDSARGRRLPAKLTGDGFVTEVTTEGASLALLWDTAATHTILRRDGGTPRTPRTTKVGGFDLDFHFVPANLPGLPADGLVGVDFFREHAVTFDFQRVAIYVDP